MWQAPVGVWVFGDFQNTRESWIFKANSTPSSQFHLKPHQFWVKKQGIEIIDFVQGEPDFDTPDHIKQAAIEAINAGFTKYTDIYGIPELREAVADKLKRENNVEYEVDQIIITSGTKSALY